MKRAAQFKTARNQGRIHIDNLDVVQAVVKLDQCSLLQTGKIAFTTSFHAIRESLKDRNMTYPWQEAYRTAILETDWTKMDQRVQLAESEIDERERVLSSDHGGTLEERQAIEDALHGLRHLKTELSDWRNQQIPRTGAA